MRAITEQQKQEAIAAFAYEGTLIADTVYGSGHINDTFRLTFAVGNMRDQDEILQRMNADAFPHPEQLMENIAGVTGFLKKKIIARGGYPESETLNIIPTVDNKPFYANAKAVALLGADTPLSRNTIRIGAEWNMSKNYGGGLLYDVTRPFTDL